MMRELDPLKGKQVSDTAICGKTARRGWRMTCNVPLANCCGNCSKAWTREWKAMRKRV